VQLPLGRELEVELGANPTTGYTWQFTAGSPSPLRFKSRRYQPAAAGATCPGRAGMDLFVFEAAAPGTEQLHFEYRRGDAGQPPGPMICGSPSSPDPGRRGAVRR